MFLDRGADRAWVINQLYREHKGDLSSYIIMESVAILRDHF